jgi:hypothetical protein
MTKSPTWEYIRVDPSVADSAACHTAKPTIAPYWSSHKVPRFSQGFPQESPGQLGAAASRNACRKERSLATPGCTMNLTATDSPAALSRRLAAGPRCRARNEVGRHRQDDAQKRSGSRHHPIRHYRRWVVVLAVHGGLHPSPGSLGRALPPKT